MCTIAEQLKEKGVNIDSILSAGKPVGKKETRGNGKHRPKVATPTESTSNCFSVNHEELTEGIPMYFGNSIAVYVGDEENGGREWFIPFDRDNGPDLTEDTGNGANILRADIGLVKTNKGTSFKTLVKDNNNEKSVLVVIRTGRRNVLKSRFLQRVKMFAGNPLRVIGGTVCSRYGKVSSLEQLWLLREGDSVMICFFDGSIKLLSYNKKGQVVVNHGDKEHGEKLFRMVSRLEEIESLLEGGIKSRDRGYHTAIDTGLRTGFLQGALGILEEAAKKHDLRFKVVERLLKMYTDSDEGTLRRLFEILCTNDKVYKNLKVTTKANAEKEEIDNMVKMRDGAYHHAIDIASNIGWWEGVAELLMGARKSKDLRAGVFNHFRNECDDGKVKALVGDSLHEVPDIASVAFLAAIPSRKPRKHKSTRAQIRTRNAGITPSSENKKEEKAKKQKVRRK